MRSPESDHGDPDAPAPGGGYTDRHAGPASHAGIHPAPGPGPHSRKGTNMASERKYKPTLVNACGFASLPRDVDFGAWLCPMPNNDPRGTQCFTRAIRACGPDFRYRPCPGVHSLPSPAAGVRSVLRWLPGSRVSSKGPSKAPSAEKREKGRSRLRFRGRHADGKFLRTVAGGDPGSTETARMCAETAMGIVPEDGQPRRTDLVGPMMALEDRL